MEGLQRHLPSRYENLETVKHIRTPCYENNNCVSSLSSGSCSTPGAHKSSGNFERSYPTSENANDQFLDHKLDIIRSRYVLGRQTTRKAYHRKILQEELKGIDDVVVTDPSAAQSRSFIEYLYRS